MHFGSFFSRQQNFTGALRIAFKTHRKWSEKCNMFRKAQNSTVALRIASKKASNKHRFPLVFDTFWLHFSRPRNLGSYLRFTNKTWTIFHAKRCVLSSSSLRLAKSQKSSETLGIWDLICDLLTKLERFFMKNAMFFPVLICDYLIPKILPKTPELWILSAISA